jgi:V/A-type H+/Na+-transporting ATPase subunit I
VIVGMSKVEIAGPRELLLPVLETIQRAGLLQVAPEAKKTIPAGAVDTLRPLTLDSSALAERLFLEDLSGRIERLMKLLPKVPSRESYLSLPQALNSIAAVLTKQLDDCQERVRHREALQSELGQLNRYRIFLGVVESLATKAPALADRAIIGVEARDSAALDQISKLAALLPATTVTANVGDGSYIGLLTTEKELADKLKENLRGSAIPEISLPSYLESLPLPEKIKAAQARQEALAAEIAATDRALADLARTWRGMYDRVQAWIEQRLLLLRTSASLYQTERCFVVFGWVPSADVPSLQESLAKRHGDSIIVEEREILKQDLDEVPVVLRNPRYLQPFELLVRLLPLPRYTSIDPTPFVAIFFPLFFGMILGDSGYGSILLLAALAAILFARRHPQVRQAGEILLLAAIYSIIFGVLYGECFGELGVQRLGLHPGWIDRRTSILPMIYFALAVGGVHVVLGLILGFVSALKGRRTKEAAFRLLSILVVICIAGIVASYFAPLAALLRRPFIVAVLVITPVLLLTGGFLAPFELVRYVGNVISYVRIMAVGLASVLLASVANRLAGEAGSLWVGVTVAILLHAFNILLGVFAPTVHALRLHYVEFFSKFVESGGKNFKPLKMK